MTLYSAQQGDSILSVICDFEDPLSVVLAESDEHQEDPKTIPVPRNGMAQQKVFA